MSVPDSDPAPSGVVTSGVAASHAWTVLTRLDRVVPPRMVELIEARGPGVTAVEPLPSASVVLVRDTADGLETYLLHRHARMSFAASMVVFPGGRLDAADASLVGCALRETEEETGVQLDAAALRPWAHWVTPEVEPRRYDTYFFMAPMPDDEVARDISGETDRAEWTRPSVALAAYERGEIGLMPPTRSILLELDDADSVAALLEAADGRVIAPVLPELVETASGWEFRYPRLAGGS